MNDHPIVREFDKSIRWKLLFPSFILFIYVFIAFLPLPSPIKTGLDPSWAYAISQAVQKQLIFGKDIIFTYGPLGYLITGAVLSENFFQIIIFRWFVYLLLFIVTILRIVTLKSLIQQIFIGLSIIFSLFIGTPYIGVGMSTDYQILFIFLVILSFDNFIKKYPRLLFLLLGAVSGFCALTKLTLGIYTFGLVNLFLLVNIYQSFRNKSKIELVNYVFAIINSGLGFISITLIFLAPDQFLLSLNKIMINLLIAGGMGVSVGLFQKLIKKKSESKGEIVAKLCNIIFRNNLLLPWLVFYVIYCLLLVHTIFFSESPSLIDYLKNSLEISSGYSSAMSIVGFTKFNFFKIQLAIAISDFFLIIWLMFLITKEGYLNLSLSLFFVIFLSFKHGFVRQDGHVVVFAIVVPLVTSLLILRISKFRHQKISYYLFAYILIASLLISFPYISPRNQAKTLMPKQAINNLSYLFDIKNLRLTIDKETRGNLANVQLPDNVKNLVNGKTIDIIPWEISLVPTNQLNWKPRPIFQSYSAYTKTLDNFNFESISKSPRDYIFYNFTSIDGRHPFFDEPKTFSYVFCNYEPSANVPDFVKTPKLSNIVLLEKRNVSRCLPDSLSEISSIPWDSPHSIKVSNGAIIRANVKFQYSLIGKLYKTLFRSPPVMMKIDYVDNSQKTYRIIPENSENGVIVSHLPKDDNEALSFFRGQLPAKVKSFSFQTSNSLLYAPRIELSFLSDILRD
ncbi:hypothetical protein PN471_14855 [Aphanizomenon sp. CS-733/32]|uniref:hypothetical protein n=1 Tax=Aphanizomenon sp. CS-733/32 TaxID=3021715 RepID=UPI00232EBBA1|nr:hypothetical protein [Aphanizomenon sp. CS-733/32]MDB9309890.1 hypothetical protein [Aphanizomenon sp. CS-733/32]